MSILHWLYFLFGLVCGSFLNVCIYRIPRRESIVSPGSHCPACGSRIRPWDNIPLLSYIFLRGRCRACGSPISPRYPAVELITGLAFLACAKQWAFTPPTFVNSLFLALIIVLVFVDFEHQILPDVVTLPGAMAGILLSPFQAEAVYRDFLTTGVTAALPWELSPPVHWTGAIVGALIGGGILFIFGWAYERIRRRAGLGMGDVKMMSMVGAFLGWRLALMTIFAGSLAGSVLGLFLVLFKGKTLQHKLAFGTFLGAGAAAMLFLGLPFLGWYTAPR
ncbi:MAG: prepilin peptidase [Acidobacteria bacterium]|nr:prepilin peptidase [Acidobacteriota bacterium]